jgi:hypothetical protein
MKRVRLILLFGVLALIVALVPAAAAQDQTFGLTQEEFDALTTANANSTMASSYDYAFTMGLSSAADGDVMALTGSGAISDGFSMDVTGTLGPAGESMPIAMGLIVVDDSLYVSLDGTSWYGATGEELAQQFGTMLPVSPDDVASGDLSALGMGDMSSLQNLDPADFISITAAADGSTTDYTLTVDLAAVLNNPDMQMLMGMAMMSAGTGDMAAMPTAADLEGATLTITQTVDTAAELVQQTVIKAVIPAEGDTATLTFDISLSNYGDAAAVTAPASSQPLMQLMQGLMGGMSGM